MTYSSSYATAAVVVVVLLLSSIFARSNRTRKTTVRTFRYALHVCDRIEEKKIDFFFSFRAVFMGKQCKTTP